MNTLRQVKASYQAQRCCSDLQSSEEVAHVVFTWLLRPREPGDVIKEMLQVMVNDVIQDEQFVNPDSVFPYLPLEELVVFDELFTRVVPLHGILQDK